ncbi:MAG: FapA family protein, partial [bacterium]
EIGGAPIVSKGVIRVDPIYIVEGDVDYSTGNINFPGTVAIRGSVLDGFEVNAGGDVIVENTIQSARVTAVGDVVVKRGILTREKGLVASEGNIYAKFIENSTVECEGNVIVETAILNSKVYSNGRVIAIQNDGAIIGGRIIAFDRIICRNLGSTAHAATIAQTGYRFEVQHKYLDGLARLHAIQKQIKEIQKNYEYLSAAKANDMDRIGKLRGDMIKLIRVHDSLKEELIELNNGRIFNQFAMVEVEQTIYPGVSILLGDIRHAVNKEARYASFKWDSEQKNIYMSSFDEVGQGIQKNAAARAKTVLIIDDSKAVRKTLRMILEKIGLKVVDEAEDGLIGVEKYKKLRPSLVTCDIMMVNMNGVETLTEIRKENPKARVVMITSIRDKSKILDCVMAGARDYILKPFVPSRVITVIKNVLES